MGASNMTQSHSDQQGFQSSVLTLNPAQPLPVSHSPQSIRVPSRRTNAKAFGRGRSAGVMAAASSGERGGAGIGRSET